LDYTGTSKKNVWTLNKSKINKLNKALNKEFMTWGLQENTIDNVFDLANDKEFMKALKNYKGGAVDLDSALFKKVFKPGQSGELSYAYMQLGRILRGEIELEGIKKDKALGNKIIKSIFHKTARNSEGPMNTAASQWSRHQLAKDFDNPKATYDSLRRTISDAFKDAEIKNINVDEIFPLRTGQLTIGKGSGAFNNFVQFIDSNINQKAKRQFDGMASTRYQGIIEARKKGDWATVKKLVGDHENAINIFYENNPKARGKVKLPKLHYDEKTRKFLKPSQVFDSQYGTGTYKAIPQKIRKGMEKFYTKTGLSLDPGTTMTLEKAAADIKNNPMKFLKDLGYKCRLAGGAGESVACYMKDVEKTRADMKSSNVEVRAKALTKQRKALQLASKMPQIGKILKTAIQAGTAAITTPLKALGLTSGMGYAIEGIVEGGFYDNARRKGYTHEQAFAETFSPRLIKEGVEGKSTEDVPWYGGAETLLEQELIGDPKQNPKVAQYVDALKEQDRIYDLIRKKEVLKDQPTTTNETLFIPGDLAAASTDVHDLARSGAYRRVDQTFKPESMAAQAYETAVERQKGKQDQRRREYLEKYDPGALKYEERTLSTPRQLEKRYEAMEEKYPTYTREQLEDVLEAWGIDTPWNAGFASGVKGYDEMGEWLKTHDKYKTMEAGVANVAEGGIVGLLKK